MKVWPWVMVTLAGCSFDGWSYHPRDAAREAAMDVAGDDADDLGARTDVTDASDVTDTADVTDASPDAAPDASIDVPIDAMCGGSDAACPPTEPRLIAPVSGSVVTARRPTLRWQLATGATGTTIDVCRDRACATVESTFATALDRASVPVDLTPGVHWWRAAGTVAGSRVTAFSPTWVLTSGSRTGLPESVIGRMLDLDGDGYADLATSTSGAGRAVYEIRGGSRTVADRGTAIHSTGSAADRRDDLFGERLSAAGDVDGDGFTDLLVGSRGYSSERGAAWLVRGGPVTGERVPTRIDPPPLAGAEFGSGVAGAGDVNGDGYGDLLISGSGRSSPAVFVFAGGPGGPVRVLNTLRGAPATDFAGTISGVGDLNADGFADLVISTVLADHRGRVAVHFGSASGVVEPAAVTIPSPSAMPYTAFGSTICPAGDVNGDGYADLVVGDYALERGRAYLFLGGPGGPTATPAIALEAPAGGEDFGASLSGVGDVNGDGLSDVVVGAPQSTSDAGRVWVYLGHATAPLAAAPQEIVWTTPEGTGVVINQRYGTSLSSAGDVDRDGFADVMIAATSRNGTLRQRLVVFRGGAAGVVTPAAWVIDSPRAPTLLDYGRALAP